MELYLPTPNKLSRNYTPEERDSEDFRRVVAAMGISRGAYRNWEYPAILAAIGDPLGKRILSIGAYQCAISLYLSHFADELVAVDRVACEALIHWGETQAYGWGSQTEFRCCDAGGSQAPVYPDDLPEGPFDIIISAGAIEHNDGILRNKLACQVIAGAFATGATIMVLLEAGAW